MGKNTWFKLYINEVLNNFILEEFLEDECLIYIRFIALSAISRFKPLICVTPTIGYNEEQLCSILKTNPELYHRTITKLIKFGFIELLDNEVIKFNRWDKHRSEYERQKTYRNKNKKEEKQ